MFHRKPFRLIPHAKNTNSVWRDILLTSTAIMAVLLAIMAGGISDVQAQAGDSVDVPIYDDLGNHHLGISSTVPLVQRYFDQGLRLYYAFNHAEAIRAFREAQRLDDDCAMCWWGEALAWGPNINLPMDTPSARAAFTAVQGALTRKVGVGALERALIDALALRYAEDAPEDRSHLDQAYADAMAGIVQRFPDHEDSAVLYAESLMDLRPWDYWTAGGNPKPGIEDALAQLEAVIAENPQHPGACHFYIHAVEAVYPERAIACAERLARLMPGAGHLVHMPGHIYIRVGRYRDAVTANEHAVHADETYIQDQQPGMGMYTAGYYPHNYDFMAFAAMMIGRSQTSIDSAERVTSLLPAELFGSPGMDFLQHWTVRPLQMRVRFARWEDIMAVEAPPRQSLHARGIWHYARGRALLAQGDLQAAGAELAGLREIAASATLEGLRMEFNESSDLLAIAERILTGWHELRAGNNAAAIESLEKAVNLEDALFYGEPPEWSVPARQDLGTVLLIAGKAGEAESVFRQDLTKFPDNGWSLYGLTLALRAQARSGEAEAVASQFQSVWDSADLDIAAVFPR